MNSLNTKRLVLIPITVELCNADKNSRKIFSEGLRAWVPDTWPPALLTLETLEEFITLLTAPNISRLYAWYWVCTGVSCEDRILIGSGGFVRGEDGTLELGYSVLEEFQRQGYATEAIRTMIMWARDEYGAQIIRACTFCDLIGSIRVLEKSGFVRSGKGDEEGSIVYLLTL
jgi:[ribosomal protein S5]-alanine N-acetyltransferase